MATWPPHWQPEAVRALEPLLGTDEVVEIWFGDPTRPGGGSLLGGYVYEAEDGRATIIHDRSGRPDVYPWPVLDGPVLRLTARREGGRRRVVYQHPTWTPSAR